MLASLLPVIAEVSMQDAGQMIITAAGSAVGGYGLCKMRVMRIEPQPLEVKKVGEYATKKDLDELRKSVNAELRAIDARVDTITPMMGELKGKLDGVEKTNRQILEILLQK